MDIIIRTSRLQRKAIQNALLFYIHLQYLKEHSQNEKNI